jgi:tight adherence protein B
VSPAASLLKLLALILLSVGPAALFVFVFVLPSSPFRTLLQRYVNHTDAQLRFLRSDATGKQVLGWQLAAFVFFAVLADFGGGLFALFELVVLFGPPMQLRQLREKRVIRIEQQLDSWLLILANALKAVPSIGDALSSSQALMHAPISQELDIVLKEYRLGTALDNALRNMGERIKSRVITTALTMLQVARRTGGDLPSTLETSAASLRELARLEGVVRTKTADGRNQAFVVGTLPGLIIIALYFVQKELLLPLFTSFKGNILLAVAIALWVGAIASALKILKVDI